MVSVPFPHEVHPSSGGERCRCGNDATHKVGEELPLGRPSRHNFTQYLCCTCFGGLFGDWARQWCRTEDSA